MGRGIRSMMELWPGLLARAVALNLIELLLRKWRGLVEFLRLRPQGAAAG